MPAIETAVANDPLLAWGILAVAFAILAKCADIFVNSSVSLANRFHVPKLVIGIVLVSLATTAPELSVSLMSAIRGDPAMALGNAVGSVICDDGLALALCGIMAPTAIAINPYVLKSSGRFLLAIELLAFLFILPDCTLGRMEGIILLALFVGYIAFLFVQHKRGKIKADEKSLHTSADRTSLWKLALLFLVALAGIIFASEFIIISAKEIATDAGIPPAIVAMTLVAFGTSIPEVATCVVAARKGEGALAVGNIIGADIMNICWVAGASAIANDLTLEAEQIYFMFPAMFVIVGAMLFMLRMGYRLTRKKGFILLGLYVAYLISFFAVFPPSSESKPEDEPPETPVLALP